MGLNYKHQGIVDFNDKYQKQMNTALENLNSLKKQVLNYVGIESKGEFALQSQNYMNNAVIPSLEGIETVLQLYLDLLTDLIKTTLDTIDKQENGAVVSDHLLVYLELNDKIYNKINEIYPDINTNISNANNYGLNISKLNFDDTQYSQLKSKVETIHTNMQNLSNNNYLQQEVITCISNVQQLIKFMDGVNAAGIQTYNNDQLLNQDWYQGLISTTIEQIMENTTVEEWGNKSFPPSFSIAEERAFTRTIVDKVASGQSKDMEWVNKLLNKPGVGEERFRYYYAILIAQTENVYSDAENIELAYSMAGLFFNISFNPITYKNSDGKEYNIEYNYKVETAQIDNIYTGDVEKMKFKGVRLTSAPQVTFDYEMKKDGYTTQITEYSKRTWTEFYYIPSNYKSSQKKNIMTDFRTEGERRQVEFLENKNWEEIYREVVMISTASMFENVIGAVNNPYVGAVVSTSQTGYEIFSTVKNYNVEEISALNISIDNAEVADQVSKNEGSVIYSVGGEARDGNVDVDAFSIK